MAYTEEKDYSRLITQRDLNDILEEAAENYSSKSSTSVRMDAELMAEAKIKLYLKTRYDMANEFALTPSDNRDQTILHIYLTLSVYFIHVALSARDVPEVRIREYKEAIDMLESIRDGNMTLDITPVEDTYGSTVVVGNKKFISKPFTDGSIETSSNLATQP